MIKPSLRLIEVLGIGVFAGGAALTILIAALAIYLAIVDATKSGNWWK